MDGHNVVYNEWIFNEQKLQYGVNQNNVDVLKIDACS
jgi:hypothetical protein